MDDAIYSILAIATSLTILAILVAFTWRAISRPRLRLVYDDERRRWTTTRRDVIQYVASMPFLIMVWELFFLTLLGLLPNYEAEKLIYVPTGFVIAIRVLAHFWTEPALEFAKVVPVVVVTSALVMVQLPTWDEWEATFEQVIVLDQDHNTTLSLLIVLTIEFVAATMWFFIGVRRRAPRGANVPGIPWRDYPDANWMRARSHSSPFAVPATAASPAAMPPDKPSTDAPDG